MDMSQEVSDVLTTIKLLVKESADSVNTSRMQSSYDFRINSHLEELIDVNKINFCNDETWLYESSTRDSNIKDLKVWLYEASATFKDVDFRAKRLSLISEVAKMDTKKIIDSRTFTRPKKRLNRPSIEMYNEGYFKMNTSSTVPDNNKYKSTVPPLKLNESVESTSNPTENKCVPAEDNIISVSDDRTILQGDTISEINRKMISQSQAPLNFDFSQPTTSSIFDKIVAAAPDVDSFQNMSPPSLVNSLCSSTFANLMENSFIKNDPVLREIRDANYTEAMLQDCDPPLFKSFTDSCSSINSDTPEGFLKRTVDTTFNKIYKKNISKDKENFLNETYTANDTIMLNRTYEKDSSSNISSTDACYNDGTLVPSTIPQHQTKVPCSNLKNTVVSPSTLNGTYRKRASVNLNDTFKKSSDNRSNKLIGEDLNSTITIVDAVDSNLSNNTKGRSYIIDNRHSSLNHTTNLKRNSTDYLAGSADSLDYMSSLSNSSKGSNKMLNMAEVDAIVLQQEQSLQQVISTPKPSSKGISKLWENNCISPIAQLDRGDQLSDSEISSNDEYLTVSSNTSNTLMTPFGSETQVLGSNKSLESLNRNSELPRINPRSRNAIPMKTVSNKRLDDQCKRSYSNLKTVGTNLKSSYTNLRSGGSNIKAYSNLAAVGNNIKGSYSNLKTMSNNLKASYTQLKPVLTNLPCTDTNLKPFNSSVKLSKQPLNQHIVKDGYLKIAEVSPTVRETARDQLKSASALNNYAKSHVKASGLPRPVSGIPRPMASRIPGAPNGRPTNSRQLIRPVSKINLNDDF